METDTFFKTAKISLDILADVESFFWLESMALINHLTIKYNRLFILIEKGTRCTLRFIRIFLVSTKQFKCLNNKIKICFFEKPVFLDTSEKAFSNIFLEFV